MIGIFWFKEEVEDGVFRWGHGGSTTGVCTFFVIYPSDNIGIVVLTNGPGGNNLYPIVSKLYEYGKIITNTPPGNPTCLYDKTTDELVIKSVDPDNDKIKYGVSWSNNQNVDLWTEYFNSSLEVKIDCDGHKGNVGVIAEDQYGGQSEWISVTPKIKLSNLFTPIIERLIQRFPILEFLL
jgi:hypothetical protein